MASRYPWGSIAGLIFALAFPFSLMLVPSMAHQDLADVRQDLWMAAAEWAATLILVMISVYWERLPFAASVGLRKPQWFDAIAALLALVATFATASIVLAAFRLNGAALSPEKAAEVQALPLLLRLTMVLTAGFCEEVIYRGYALERMASLTRTIWIGVPVTILLFTLAHTVRYGFSPGLIGVAVTGTFLALLYVWRRNLWPCIAMHWIIDGVGLLLGPIGGHH